MTKFRCPISSFEQDRKEDLMSWMWVGLIVLAAITLLLEEERRP